MSDCVGVLHVETKSTHICNINTIPVAVECVV